MFYSRYTIFVFLYCVFSASLYAQAQNDSIKSITLDEVIVSSDNIYREDNHISIIPTNTQKEQSPTGYALLYNLMIPGIIINDDGSVSTMGFQSGLYINGQPADVQDIIYLRPNEVSRVEIYDAPTGKYAKDNIAINFIIKQSTYGGHVHILGEQSLGVNDGRYRVSTSLSKNATTYSLFGGYHYSNLQSIHINSIERYDIDNIYISRESSSIQSLKNNDEYLQFQIRHQEQSKYIVGKLSVTSNHTPEFITNGSVLTNSLNYEASKASINSKSISPKIDLNGEFLINQSNTITWGIHGKYSNNKYNRLYSESANEYLTDASEDAGKIDIGVIYTRILKKGEFSAELFNHYDIFKTQYGGNYSATEHLWKNEALAFLSYNYPFNESVSLQARLGLDWYQFNLQRSSRFNTWNPRLNIRLNSKINKGMILWSFMLANSNYDTNIINNAVIQINPFLVRKGNPNIKKSHDIDTYVYYSLPIKRFNLTAMLQYQFTKNPVTYSYEQDDNTIIQSFNSEGSNHQISAIIGATYQPCNKFALTGDIRYLLSKVNTKWKVHHNNITGNIALQWYFKSFQLIPSINFASSTLNKYSLIKIFNPLNYSLKLSYSHKNLVASASIYAPFRKRKIEYSLSSPYFISENTILNHQNYRYCTLSLSYLFEFGKKTTQIKPDIDTNINSSMLRDS